MDERALRKLYPTPSILCYDERHLCRRLLPPTSDRIQEQLTTRLPLMWFSLAFLAGIVLASLVSLSIWIWVGLSLLFLILLVFIRFFPPFKSLRATRSSLLPFILLPLFFYLPSFSARRAISFPFQNLMPSTSPYYNDRDYDLLITGTLVEPPDYRDNYTNLRLDVEKVDTGDRDLPAHGLILVRASNNQIFHYGERLRLRGKLKTPPENEDFSYRDYLAAQHIHSYMSSAEVTVLPYCRAKAAIRYPLYRCYIGSKRNHSITSIVYSLTPNLPCWRAFCSAWIQVSHRNYNKPSRTQAPHTLSPFRALT